MERIYDLVIIGGGPGGIASAVEAYILGYDKILFIEKGDNHSQTIRHYYKDSKRVDKDWKGQKVELDGRIYFVDGTKETTLDFFDEIIDHHSVELQTHVEVQSIEKKEHFFAEKKNIKEVMYFLILHSIFFLPNHHNVKQQLHFF